MLLPEIIAIGVLIIIASFGGFIIGYKAGSGQPLIDNFKSEIIGFGDDTTLEEEIDAQETEFEKAY